MIYISGPFNHDDKIHGIGSNILNASKVALECWRAGWAVICPHKNTGGFQHVTNVDIRVWMEGDLEFVRRSDAILLIDEWRSSPGALEEYSLAKELGKTIYDIVDGIPSPFVMAVGFDAERDWPRKL